MSESSVLDLTRNLCAALDLEGIAYCHWKSNITVDRALSGDDDLDLLVGRAEAQRFTSILVGLGFKEAQAPMNIPGVLHYYGFDAVTGKIVHVHVYYQLILGRDVTKGYRIPVERSFLEHAVENKHLRIAAPEFEFIIFVIRMVFKFSVTDAIFGGRLSLSTAAQRELEYLKSQVEQTCIYNILKQDLPSIDARLFEDCLRSLQPNCTLRMRLNVRQRLQNKLRSFASRSQMSDTFLGIVRQITEIGRRRIFGFSFQKRIAHGGTMIALLGGDGSGKSTTVNELYTWLHEIFDVVKVHMGRPPRSWSTACVDIMLGVERRLRILLIRNNVEDGQFLNYLRLLRCVSVARDRYRTYKMARTHAVNGGIVICDRYPIQKLKLMDGPQAYRISDIKRNKIVDFLMRRETQYYQLMMPPDLLIVLRVAPDIAVQRKVDEDPMSVRERSQEIWEADWQGTGAHVVDAGRSKAQVLNDIKSLVWSQL